MSDKKKPVTILFLPRLYELLKKKAREIAYKENRDCSVQTLVNELVDESAKRRFPKEFK